MASGGGKRRGFEEELHALSAVAADPGSAAARALLVDGLRSRRSLVVARAARLAREHRVGGLEAELQDAFARFFENAKKSDPSCQAKLATLEALDYGESLDAAPFLRAVRHVQYEPADTAAGLRGRGIVGLARIGDPDFDLVAA